MFDVFVLFIQCKNCMTTSESKGRFFTKRIDSHNECNRIDSNRELECSSTQTAGLAFGGTDLCSYRVRGVDGSCTEHLTVESLIQSLSANSHTYWYSTTHSLFHARLKPSFSANPSHRSLSFSSSGLTTSISQTVYSYFWAYPFLLFSFSVLHFLAVGSMQ